MKRTFEELVQLRQDGKISWVEFLKESDYVEDYEQWLADRGAEADEDNAQLFLDMTENSFLDSQDNDYQYV